MARLTRHEQFEKMMKMSGAEHERRAANFTAQAEARDASANAAEWTRNERLAAAEIFDEEAARGPARQVRAKKRQAKRARDQARAHGVYAEQLRKQEMLLQTHAQNHTLALGRIALENARIRRDAIMHAQEHRRVNPTGTRTHNELVDFHTARLSEAAGLAPHSIQHQGETIRITHKPVAGLLPAQSWLAKTIRKTRTGHPHGTKGGRRKTRRHRRRSKRRRTRKHRTKRRRTRRRHKRRRRRRRRR